jgi:hypothetical protein
MKPPTSEVHEILTKTKKSADLSRASSVLDYLGTPRCDLFGFVWFRAGLGFGLVSAGFAVLYGFMYFVVVSAALAAFCLVLGWSPPVSLFCAGFALHC